MQSKAVRFVAWNRSWCKRNHSNISFSIIVCLTQIKRRFVQNLWCNGFVEMLNARLIVVSLCDLHQAIHCFLSLHLCYSRLANKLCTRKSKSRPSQSNRWQACEDPKRNRPPETKVCARGAFGFASLGAHWLVLVPQVKSVSIQNSSRDWACKEACMEIAQWGLPLSQYLLSV